MWDQFLVYKDSVNAVLIKHKVDPILRQGFTEHLSPVLSSVASSRNGAMIPRFCTGFINSPSKFNI